MRNFQYLRFFFFFFLIFSLTSLYLNQAEVISIEDYLPNFNKQITQRAGTLSNNSLSILSNGKGWVVTKHTGIESDFDLFFLNSKNKSTRICFTPKAGVDITGNTGERLLLDEQGNPILDNQDKEISLKYESNKCDLNGTKYDGYTVDLSTAQMVNVNDYVKFGNNSIVLEYQDINVLNYQDTWFDLNISLAVNLTGQFDSTVNDIWVFAQGENNKFGANFTSEDIGDLQFKYIVNSDREIKKGKGFDYYISNNVEKHNFDFSDICEPRRNNTRVFGLEYDFDTTILFDPQCNFDLNGNDLEIEFYSEHNATQGIYSIDPSISIIDVSSATSTLTNITCETGYCHQTISSSTPVLNNASLSLYAPFAVAYDRSTNISFDFSSGHNDGIGYAQNNMLGYFGLGTEADFAQYGKWGGVTFGDFPEASFVNNNITFMMWIRPFSLVANHGSESIFASKGSGTGGSGNARAEWRFEIGSDSNLEFRGLQCVNDATIPIQAVSSGGEINVNQWNHVAFVWNGTSGAGLNSVELFVNGISVATAVQGAGTLCGDQTAPFEIGGRTVSTGTNSRMFNGTMDEVMLITKTLTAAEILAIVQNNSARFEPTGIQEFRENNITSGTFLNITINSSTNFNSNITVAVGNVSGTTYAFGDEFSFTNDFASDIPLGTPQNFSLKFTYYGGNGSANSFITPSLENNIDITSFGAVAPVVDNDYPIFSNLINDTANNTAYVSGFSYGFNATVTSTNATVNLEFDGINYTASNSSSAIFNATVIDLAAGTYTYFWWAFGNGTDNNFNTSSIKSYTVAQAVPEGTLTNTDPWTVEYPEQVTIGLSESNAGDGDVTYIVHRDDVSIGSGETITLGVAAYNYLLNTTGGQNYTFNVSMEAQTLTVTQNNTFVLNLAITPSSSESFGTATTATGTLCPSELTCILYRDDVVVANPEVNTLGVAVYNYTYNTTGNTNYSRKVVSELLTINQIASEVNLTLGGAEGNITIAQGSSLLLNGTLITGDAGGTLNLYNNGTLINVGPTEVSNDTIFNTLGEFNITVIYLNSQNYTTSLETYYVTVTDTAGPVVTNFIAYAINSSQSVMGNESFFNTGNLTPIEFMSINFTVTDTNNISGDITLRFTADGGGACSLGNKQDSTCYNLSNSELTKWIVFKNGTETSTFKDEGAAGDFIDCSYEGSSSQRNYTCLIDEHYNPNVFKHYNASYNFSDVKWQEGINQRIRGTRQIKVTVPSDKIPLNADQYKLDIRINVTGNPTSPLEAWVCNSTYTTGNSEITDSCTLVTEKLPSDLQAGGTKFRGIFTKQLVDSLGDIAFIVLRSDQVAGANYYSIKTYAALATSYTTQWEFSTNNGVAWANLGDGYESELNINWFINGATPTKTVFMVESTDGLGNTLNSTTLNVTWSIDPAQNYAPIINLMLPSENQTIGGLFNITWTVAEPNDDNFTTNFTLDGTIISPNLNNATFNFSWDTTTSTDGNHNLTATTCEVGTSPILCGNTTHSIIIDNTAPNVSDLTETPSDPAVYIQGSIYEFNASIIDLFLRTVLIEFDGINSTPTASGDIYNLTITDLGVGVYSYTWFANDTVGNVNNSEGGTYTINQAASEVNLTLNGTEGNISIDQGTTINLNGTLITGDPGGVLNLYNNGTLINIGVSPLGNSTAFNTVGLFNITVIYVSSQNYSTSLETYYVNVTSTLDVTPPAVTSLTESPPDPATYSQGQAYGFNATVIDITQVDTVILVFNGTNHSATNLTTNVFNVTITDLAVGTYNYTWFANDTLGNVNDTEFGGYVIIRAVSVVNLTLNGTQGNITIFNGTTINLNGTLTTGEGNLLLFNNKSLINDGISPIGNFTLFNNTGSFNITLSHPQTQNFTKVSQTFYVTVNPFTVPTVNASIVFKILPNFINTVPYVKIRRHLIFQ